MRALVQRVSEAAVSVGGEEVARIGPGLLVLLGVRRGDGPDEADRIARKLLALRVFEDDDGRMNRSVEESGGELLCVSQFTLYGDVRKGNRPSFVEAAPPEEAEPLYERVRAALGARRSPCWWRRETLLRDLERDRGELTWPWRRRHWFGTSSTSAASGSSPPATGPSRS